MKTYVVFDWVNASLENGDLNPDCGVKEMTEEQILYEYWDFWFDRMTSKYGEGHPLITHKNCIEDWVTENWAWELY